MNNNPQPNSELKANVIKSVTNPLGFFALAMLVIEGVLLVIAGRAAQSDLTLVLIISAALIVILVGIFSYVVFKNPSILLASESVVRLVEMKTRIETLDAQVAALQNALNDANQRVTSLQKENQSLQQELDKFKQLKLQLLALLNRAGSMSLQDFLNDLRLADDARNRGDVLNALGTLAKEGEIEGDGMRPQGYYRLKAG